MHNIVVYTQYMQGALEIRSQKKKKIRAASTAAQILDRRGSGSALYPPVYSCVLNMHHEPAAYGATEKKTLTCI